MRRVDIQCKGSWWRLASVIAPCTLLLAAIPAVRAQDNGIALVGLSAGKAVIAASDGRPKVYRVGDTLPNGAKLVSVSAEDAVVEADGKRQKLTIGGQISLAGTGNGLARVTLTANLQGHFETLGSIDGATVRFLVDTGATMISMGIPDARRIGIDYTKGQPGYASTANGTVRVYRVRLNTVKVGDITLNGVDALVHESSMEQLLLGMTFLNRVEMTRKGDSLTLIKRY